MIYLAHAGEMVDRYKIGRTSSKLEKRIMNIQTDCPVEVEIAAGFPGGDEIEEGLQYQFGPKRVIGEWYDLGESDVKKAASYEWRRENGFLVDLDNYESDSFRAADYNPDERRAKQVLMSYDFTAESPTDFIGGIYPMYEQVASSEGLNPVSEPYFARMAKVAAVEQRIAAEKKAKIDNAILSLD